MVSPFEWSEVENFVDRTAQLDRLEEWWASSDRQPLNLYGRRRVGKSWLFRRFAHGKPAIILVAQRGTEGRQLSEFAQLLEPILGFRPDLPDIPSLIRVLMRIGRESPVLTVIDELPYLLPRGAAARQRYYRNALMLEDERESSRPTPLAGSSRRPAPCRRRKTHCTDGSRPLSSGPSPTRRPLSSSRR